jgi:leucyl aminopeptidase
MSQSHFVVLARLIVSLILKHISVVRMSLRRGIICAFRSGVAPPPHYARLYQKATILRASKDASKAWDAGHTEIVVDDEDTLVCCVGVDHAIEESHEDVVRDSVAQAMRKLQSRVNHVTVDIDTFGDGAQVEQACAEGATLAAPGFTMKKSPNPVVTVVSSRSGSSPSWDRGVIMAQCEQHARRLADMPPNLLTPSSFGREIVALFEGLSHCTVVVRDEDWLVEQGMAGVLSVSRGSANRVQWVEIDYNPPNATSHVAMVGKGVTFDSGGISIKPAANMHLMKV